MKRIRNVAVVPFVVALCVSIGLNVRYCTQGSRESVRDTTRTTVFDTITYHKPVPKDSAVIRYVTERLPLAADGSGLKAGSPTAVMNNADSTQKPLEDSVQVRVPVTRKIYETDTYRAVVSGYQPSLDEMRIFSRNDVTIIKERKKRGRWGIGIQAGYGMTLQGTPCFAPYLGVGVTYSLWQF